MPDTSGVRWYRHGGNRLAAPIMMSFLGIFPAALVIYGLGQPLRWQFLSLTPMEEKVAALVSEGLSNPEVAERLGMSRRTVGTHMSHILKELHVSSRADIARESALRTVDGR